MTNRYLPSGVLLLLLTTLAAPGWCNALAGHPSPYLAMHGSDPVNWQPWGPEAIEQARREDKLLFVSSGYFSCHWCHVMQAESYKDPQVAAFLNRYFVPVKVDRELRPALDAYLIDFVQRTQGHAGWPLNVFLTPAGHPLTGITYLPRDQFMGYLRRLHGRWNQDRPRLKKLAAAAADALGQQTGTGHGKLTSGQARGYQKVLVARVLAIGDEMQGGFGHRAKFPSSPQLQALLNMQARQPRPRLAEFLRLTLDQMASQGLRDRLGGGFFRYTVDPDWQTPHFEKMLYDNLQLAEVYLTAGRVFDHPSYQAIGRETLAFLLKEMRSEAGAFIASFSAVDDHGVEGGYYLWAPATLREGLSEEEHAVVTLAWQMTGPPPFESGYLPVEGAEPQVIAARLGIPEPQVAARLASARLKLLARRAGRTVPADTKRLAGWNGLALGVLARTAQLPGGEAYREPARVLRDYLVNTLWDGKSLWRAREDGKPVGSASLEDYAYVADGLLAWAALGGKRGDYETARAVARQAWRRFHGPAGWRLAEAPLIPMETREPVVADGPLPSPSAVVLRASLGIAEHLDDAALRTQARAVLERDYEALGTSSFAYATHIDVLADYLAGE